MEMGKIKSSKWINLSEFFEKTYVEEEDKGKQAEENINWANLLL